MKWNDYVFVVACSIVAGVLAFSCADHKAKCRQVIMEQELIMEIGTELQRLEVER